MLGWSLGFLRNLVFVDPANPSDIVMAGLVVSSLNMLIQVFLSVAFGDKSVLKVGGKR